MSLALKFIETRQWAILDHYLRLMAAIVDRDLDTRDSVLRAIEKEWGKPVAGTRATTVRNGTAIIPVTGPLFRYANLFTSISGATSFERLAGDIGTVMRDPEVKQVIYDINSPGGEMDGIAETAELIYRFRGVKPQRAFVSHLGTSAAYWLAAATDRIDVARTSLLGSIGAVLSVVDTKGQDEKEGIKTMEFVSSVSPDKRLDPFSDDADEAARAKAKMQGLVDRMGAVFVEVVASYRGVEEEEITRTKGGVLFGPDAVEVGLADGVATLEGLIEEYSGGAERASAVSVGLAADSGSEHTTEVRAMEGQEQQAEVTIDLDFLASNHPDLLYEIRVAAASAERERILKIHALDAAGFDDLKLRMMNDPQATSGDAAEAILAAQVEQQKLRIEAVEEALEGDEADLADLGAATLPGEEGETEDQIAASVVKHFPKAEQAAV